MSNSTDDGGCILFILFIILLFMVSAIGHNVQDIRDDIRNLAKRQVEVIR